MEGKIVFHDLVVVAEIPLHIVGMVENGERFRIRSPQRCQSYGSNFDRTAHIVDLLDVDLFGVNAMFKHQ
ncbi:hypothetical protein D3C78_926750 [compost metagenome]